MKSINIYNTRLFTVGELEAMKSSVDDKVQHYIQSLYDAVPNDLKTDDQKKITVNMETLESLLTKILEKEYDTEELETKLRNFASCFTIDPDTQNTTVRNKDFEEVFDNMFLVNRNYPSNVSEKLLETKYHLNYESVLARDVAKYILESAGNMTNMKLQKLVYLCQAYSLAWTRKPVFIEDVVVWGSGPAVEELHEEYKDAKDELNVSYSEINGDSDKLNEAHRIIADHLIKSFGRITGYQLGMITSEDGTPWHKFAGNREKKSIGVPILHKAMENYYKEG